MTSEAAIKRMHVIQGEWKVVAAAHHLGWQISQSVRDKMDHVIIVLNIDPIGRGGLFPGARIRAGPPLTK
jgi:hypothetical protein